MDKPKENYAYCIEDRGKTGTYTLLITGTTDGLFHASTRVKCEPDKIHSLHFHLGVLSERVLTVIRRGVRPPVSRG